MLPYKLKRFLYSGRNPLRHFLCTSGKKFCNTGASFFFEFLHIFDLIIPDGISFDPCCLVQFFQPLDQKSSICIMFLAVRKNLIPQLFRFLSVIACFHGKDISQKFFCTFRQNIVCFFPAFKIEDIFFLIEMKLHHLSGLLVGLPDSLFSHTYAADADPEITEVFLTVTVTGGCRFCQPLLHHRCPAVF